MATIAQAPLNAPSRHGRGVVASLLDLHSRWQQRRVLQSLPDALLEDIGLTRADVAAEVRRGHVPWPRSR